MPVARSLAYPLRLTSTGALATNEQESDADIGSGLLLAMAWTQGERRRSPSYGRPPIEFTRADPGMLATALGQSEPRARTRGDLIEETIATATEQIGYER